MKQRKAAVTLVLGDRHKAAPMLADTEVVELFGEYGWLEWQDSVMNAEAEWAAKQTVPGELKE